MPDYKAMYFQLAAKVADTVELLIEAQQQGEDAFVEGEESVKTESE
jgi:hypothetical protein